MGVTRTDRIRNEHDDNRGTAQVGQFSDKVREQTEAEMVWGMYKRNILGTGP